MPFVKGVSGNPHGRSRVTRHKYVTMALSIQNKTTADEMRDWMYSIWHDGVDPLTKEAVLDLRMRWEVHKEYCNRGWGQPAQMVVVQADVKAFLANSEEDTFAPVELDDVRARRQALRGAGVRPKIIEGTATERKEMDVADVMPVDE